MGTVSYGKVAVSDVEIQKLHLPLYTVEVVLKDRTSTEEHRFTNKFNRGTSQ